MEQPPPESAGSTDALAADALQARATAEMLYSATQIDEAIERMACAAAAEFGGRNPVVLPVMIGGLFTATRLCSYFDFPYEFDTIQVSRYGQSLHGGRLEWKVEPTMDLAGRAVLIVDDILDRGVTLAAVQRKVGMYGAAVVRTAVLVVKDVERQAPAPVDFGGVQCGDRYVFGCGMDYRGFWRGLTSLYALGARS